MIPVSAMHFLVTSAYVILLLAILKMIAVRFKDRPIGQALGFLTF